MAVPSYATDLNDIYTDTDNFTAVGGGRVTATETDDYIQGANCWSHDPFSSGTEGGAYDTGTAPTLTGDTVFIWTKCDVAATLATHSAGGIQIIMGNSITAYYSWYVRGSDDYVYGGWQCIPVDPSLTGSASTTVGTPTGTLDHFGVVWYVPSTGAAKGYPMKIDAIRHGTNIETTAGDVANPATWDLTAAHDATTTRQWGICQPTDAGAAIQGDVFWGTASTSVYSRDSNRTITIIDTEWTATDFTQIIFPHASNDVEWDNIGVLALGTNNRGIIDVTANGTIKWTNSVFQDIDTTTLLTNSTFDGSKWIGCNEVDSGGGSLLNAKILEPTVAANSYGLLWDVNSDPNGKLDGMEFSKGTNAHHAIEFGTNIPTTSITLTNCDFGTDFSASENTSPTSEAGNETFAFRDTTGTLTVNLVGCTGNFGYYSAGVDVTVVADPVTATVHVNDHNGDDLQDARVYFEASDATGDLPYQQAITSISRSGTTATVTFTAAHGLNSGEYINLNGITNTLNKKDNNGAKEVTWSSTTVVTYTTLDEGDTSYTGTITATGALIFGLTDINGDISGSRTLSSDQPLIGFVRKSSASPRYKTFPISGTLETDKDLSISVQLIKDE